MAALVKSFRKVLDSGSAEQITVLPILTQAFSIRAERDNADNIYVGDSTVTALTGMYLEPGDFNDKGARSLGRGYNSQYKLSLIYIIGTAGDAVRVEYESQE